MHLRRLGSTSIATIVASLVSMGRIAPAAADPADTVRDASPRKTDDAFAPTTPNSDLVASGIFTLGVPYLAAIVIAAESPRGSDHHLYTPLAGPWLDLANREGCGDGSCGRETLYRPLLVAGGILQGAGALEIAAGFLFRLPHSVNTGSTTRFRIAPNIGRTSAGVTALGVF